MKIIKLDAIDSTNSFLKELAQQSTLENYTVVVAKNQTSGRGQQESKWVSEPFKNLTFSVFIKELNLKITHQKYLNFAISVAVFDTLSELNIANLYIKWPNDIMSVNQKICGILIENSIQKTMITSSFIGVGLNVNQTNFPNELKKVTSLKLVTALEYNLDDVLNKISINIKKQIQLLQKSNFSILENNYLHRLYKKDTSAMFKDADENLFMGIIRGISKNGNLKIELEDESITEFGIKEVSFV